MARARAWPAQPVRLRGCRNRIGELGRFDGGRALEPAACYVVDADERARVALDLETAELRAAHVGEADALRGRAGDVRERESFERLGRMHTHAVHEYWHVADAYVREVEILQRRNAFESGHGVLVLKPAVEEVEAQEAAHHARHVEVCGVDVLDEGAAAGAALDVYGVGLAER